MTRKPRFNLSGHPQHVVQRGINREPCFFEAEDYHFYLDCLDDACGRYACSVHAYVLMTNHIHLLITPEQTYALSWVMQSVGQRYVRYINRKYGRSGTLWEGRYKASLIDTETYLLICYRYLELNPVRAVMVDHPGEYRWSSYQYNAYGEGSPIVQVHAVYEALGSSANNRQWAYRELFRHHIDNEVIHDIRGALNQELVLGNKRFKDKIEKVTRRQTRPGKPGRPSKQSILENIVL
ncbi:transposase [Pseudomonadota bacterium]